MKHSAFWESNVSKEMYREQKLMEEDIKVGK